MAELEEKLSWSDSHRLASAKSLPSRFVIFFHALLFVLGFSLIFVIGWGGAATMIGKFFGVYKPVIGRLGGIVVIGFGLANLGLVKIPWLYIDTRPQLRRQNQKGWLASPMLGMFFAAGWTPCIGATLGAILTLGFSQQTSGQAMVLSSGYALGLGIPFLILGLMVEQASLFVARFKRYLHSLQIISGTFLILIGIMMLTNQMTQIAIWAQKNGYFLNLPLGGSAAPTYLIAVLAGLLSFLSPCVLPLVPAYMGYLSSHALKTNL